MSDNIRDRIKPGDRVRLRCGGILEARQKDPHSTLFLGKIARTRWSRNGSYVYGSFPDFDIVEILPRQLTGAERLVKIAEILGMFRRRIDEPELNELRELANQPLPDPLTSGMILVRADVHAALVAERDDLAARVARLMAGLTPLEADTLAMAVNMEMRKLHRDPVGAVMVKFEALMAKRAGKA